MVTVSPQVKSGFRSSGSVPTLAAAERAAKVVAGAGAGRVLLFGSVARGEARRHSDIDLMVIFDDVDYTRRQDLTMELERLARDEVGCSVDVHLTDRPEWKMRTEQVATSFESRVKSQAVLLVDKEPGEVDWDKEMVMPRSDREEAVERLGQAVNALRGIGASVVPTPYQRLMDESGQEMEAFADYQTRLARGCAAGHLAVETAVKSLIHLSAAPESQPWGHKIDELLPQLPEPHKSKIETRLALVGVENLQRWQQQARYERFVAATPEVFTGIAEAACAVALYTADQFPPGQEIATSVWSVVSFIEREIATRDLHTGRVRDDTQGRGLAFDL
ncbi:MAG: nucleotidyltransferase domain-containing protein [Acidimicrobiia bacterium]|nr:nucleotidyltransferase domain-containing protein [Acidimicrobiia bacterium]